MSNLKMTDKLRQAAQQALEALEMLTDDYDDCAVGLEIDAIVALRAALAEQPAEQQDAHAVPLVTGQMIAAGQHAWMTAYGVDPVRVFNAMLAAAPEAPQPDKRAAQEAALQWLADHAHEIDPSRETPQTKPAEQEPVGYWDGEFSEDGGATLYEVPQVSAFGRKYRNVPLYTAPQPAIPPGYTLVPVEPTPGMKERSQRAMLWAGWDAAYAALLNAAPEAPQPAKREPLPPASPCALTEAEYRIFKLGWLECEAAHGITKE